jgi:hypothetical protein
MIIIKFVQTAKKLLIGFVFSVLCAVGNCGDYSLGVYYYPGWSPFVKGQHEPDPWAAIKPYRDLEPLLSWYHDGQMEVLNQQLDWMASYGINYVIFDWYWENRRPAPETSVRAYLNAPARSRVGYALLWANHNKSPSSMGEWDDLVDYWIKRHFANGEYLRIDNKPVMYIFTGDVLRDQARFIGVEVEELLNHARQRAKFAGLAGIYFVLCVPATDYWVLEFAPKAGFDALTAYNYHFGISGDANKRTRDSHSYAELDQDYQMQWNWILANSKLPYFVPMTAGWDRRPWGGSADDPMHDNSLSTPKGFEQHLQHAKAMLDSYPVKTRRMGVICCWNEYGEGSYIEPTKRFGFEYLQRINKVFGGVK